MQLPFDFHCPPHTSLIGIDEVGRGPLVGNVVASAVLWPADNPLPQLNDSKQLSAKKRAELNLSIKKMALAWGIGEASPPEIDHLNILRATFLAMQRALDDLASRLTTPIDGIHILVDGNKCPPAIPNCCPIIKGDGKIPAISAASILAKEYRDQQMIELDQRFPQYGFAKHKGYPTQAHRQAIQQHGILEGLHRTSFKPVAQCVSSFSH